VGDIIIAIGQLLVLDPDHADALMMRHWRGQVLVLHILRHGVEGTIRIPAERWPASTGRGEW
jgi:hypothetical protein